MDSFQNILSDRIPCCAAFTGSVGTPLSPTTSKRTVRIGNLHVSNLTAPGQWGHSERTARTSTEFCCLASLGSSVPPEVSSSMLVSE